jgi:hypothetical protein
MTHYYVHHFIVTMFLFSVTKQKQRRTLGSCWVPVTLMGHWDGGAVSGQNIALLLGMQPRTSCTSFSRVFSDPRPAVSNLCEQDFSVFHIHLGVQKRLVYTDFLPPWGSLARLCWNTREGRLWSWSSIGTVRTGKVSGHQGWSPGEQRLWSEPSWWWWRWWREKWVTIKAGQ